MVAKMYARITHLQHDASKRIHIAVPRRGRRGVVRGIKQFRSHPSHGTPDMLGCDKGRSAQLCQQRGQPKVSDACPLATTNQDI